jgi:putative transposase
LLTLSHNQRWHAHYQSAGSGHLYQGCFRSFPAQDADHYLIVARSVEGNQVRAGLVPRAPPWRWGSLPLGDHPAPPTEQVLGAWPVERPAGWVKRVNAAQTAAEAEALRRCVQCGQPFSSESRVEQAVARLAWIRPCGRAAARASPAPQCLTRSCGLRRTSFRWPGGPVSRPSAARRKTVRA